jgi:hypothetical protein
MDEVGGPEGCSSSCPAPPPSAVGRGLLYEARGHLVASCTQEATLRRLTGPKFSGGTASLQIE